MTYVKRFVTVMLPLLLLIPEAFAVSEYKDLNTVLATQLYAEQALPQAQAELMASDFLGQWRERLDAAEEKEYGEYRGAGAVYPLLERLYLSLKNDDDFQDLGRPTLRTVMRFVQAKMESLSAGAWQPDLGLRLQRDPTKKILLATSGQYLAKHRGFVKRKLLAAEND